MDAILLAGGYGTRLRPLTYTRPKPLLCVAGKPLLDWAVDRLPPEVDRVIVAANWLAPKIEDHVAAHLTGGRETLVVREDKPLGTAGAIKNCQEHLRSREVLVLLADIVSAVDLAALVALHRERGAAATLAVRQVPPEQVSQFGVIDPEPAPGDARGAVRVRGFKEKPAHPGEAPSRWANAGAYVLDRSVLDLVAPDQLVSLEQDVLPQLVERGFWALPFDGHWIDVGDPQRMLQANALLAAGKPPYGAESRIGEGARLEDSIAGERLRLGAGALLRRCVLGDRVTVRPGVKLTDCVVGDGETVASSVSGQRIWTKPVPAGYPQKQVGNALPTAVAAKRSPV